MKKNISVKKYAVPMIQWEIVVMKIAMIGHKQVPSREGGIEVVVEELATRMAARGHTVELYNRWSGGKRVSGSYQGVRIYHIPTFRISALNALVYSFFAVAVALFRRYDVIHIHAEGPGAMSMLTRLFGVPSVVSIHGLDWQRQKWGKFASGYLKWAEKVSAKCADELTVLSENVRSYFLDAYGRKTHLMRNGVAACVRQQPELIYKMGLEKNGYLLFLARIVPEKGLHYLLEAFRGVKTDKKLVVAGDISADTAYIRKICRMAEQDPRVRLVNFVQGKCWEELYSNCCLYILPSEVEGMALSLLEALAYGAVCLTSDIAENRSIAEQYLHFFRSGDVKHLGQQIAFLLEQETTEREREEQMRWVREHYSWDCMAQEMEYIYQRAIEKHENTDRK